MIDLICVDVDGTLVGSSGDVLPAVWEAVERARADGARLVICSGRPAFGLTRALAERLDPEGWHVFQNGASIVHLPTGRSRSSCLPRPAVEALVARARQTGRVLELYSDTDYRVESTDERAERHAGLLGVPFRSRDLLSLDADVVRAQWVLSHAELPLVLGEPHEGLAVAASTSPVMPDTSFISVTAPGVSKATAVRSVAAEYGVPLERVMMVGDGANDLEVMQTVGTPVAMGNAEPEILAVARHHVPHVDRGGLIEALALAATL
ncbi:Cof-type HAD-IIB family hydrolase [Longimicrobium sp.]|uniref:Cof-type HAD-IIB family hydrolase n=1 Tax=Longimicrobium sp. TaxID=2029185 RepID=UPI002E3770C6|nr:Cof-type HAD-IIB family hydrolase [Longimicrobium sp.]HEX6041592.1 Cof-type HAD-IIB family hydrolase [Longimicrobium sp.]